MIVMLFGIFTEVNDVQLAKAWVPMLVTLSGIFIDVREEPLKALVPIFITLLGISISANDVHPAKAISPILVILFGNITLLTWSVAPSNIDLKSFVVNVVIIVPLIL